MNYEEALYKEFYDKLITISGINIIDNISGTRNTTDYVFLQVMSINANSINTESAIGLMKGTLELYIQVGFSTNTSNKKYENLRKNSGDLTQNILLTLLDKRLGFEIELTSGTKQMNIEVENCSGFENIGDVIENQKFTGFTFFYPFILKYR